jgi:hypothetical protein
MRKPISNTPNQGILLWRVQEKGSAKKKEKKDGEGCEVQKRFLQSNVYILRKAQKVLLKKVLR